MVVRENDDAFAVGISKDPLLRRRVSAASSALTSHLMKLLFAVRRNKASSGHCIFDLALCEANPSAIAAYPEVVRALRQCQRSPSKWLLLQPDIQHRTQHLRFRWLSVRPAFSPNRRPSARHSPCRCSILQTHLSCGKTWSSYSMLAYERVTTSLPLCVSRS
jgi:hypothetical protein